jgi:hypothetical protein
VAAASEEVLAEVALEEAHAEVASEAVHTEADIPVVTAVMADTDKNR